MSFDEKMIIGIVLMVISWATVHSAYPPLKTWKVSTNQTVVSRYWDTLVTIGKFTFNGTMTNAFALPDMTSFEDESCELLFPLDKLPATAYDDTTESSVGNCTDEELLNKLEHVFWIDPRNWDLGSLAGNEAVPHIQRIPCDYDRVTIPNTTRTFIILPPKPVKLTTLRFGYKIFTPNSWKLYSTDDYIARHFVLKSSWNLTNVFNLSNLLGSGCTERTGCECGTSDYQSEICAFVEDSCPKQFSCQNPYKPRGFCCPICGVSVSIWIDSQTFVYSKLETTLRVFIDKEIKRLNLQISWYMSKLSSYNVQLVIVPLEEYTIELVDLARGLDMYLEKASNLGVQTSYARDAGNPLSSQHEWLTVIEIPIVLIAVLIGGFAFVYLKKTKFYEGKFTFFDKLKYKPQENGENVLGKSSPTTNGENLSDKSNTTTKLEANNTQNENEKDTEPEPDPTTAQEGTINLVGTSE